MNDDSVITETELVLLAEETADTEDLLYAQAEEIKRLKQQLEYSVGSTGQLMNEKAELEAKLAPLEGRDPVKVMAYQSHLETLVKRYEKALEHNAFYGLDDCEKASRDMRAVAKAALEGE